MEPTVTTTEAAKILGCSTQTIRRYLREGKLSGFQPGRNIRIEISSIKALINRNRIGEKQNE